MRRHWTTLVVAVLFGSAAGLLAGGVGAVSLIFLSLLALVAVVCVVAYPAAGLGLLVFAIFTNASDVLIEHHGLPSLAKGYIPVVIMLIAYQWFRGSRYWTPPGTVLMLLAAYAALLTLSMFYADEPSRVAGGLSSFAKNLLLALAIAVLASRVENFRAGLWGIVAGTLFLGGLIVFKAATGSYSDFGGFGQAAVPYIYEGGASDRMSGPMEDPNFFAQFMLLGLAVSFERALSECRPLLRSFAVAAAIASLVTVVLTYSRGALLGLLCMVPFAVYRLRHYRRSLAAGAIVALLALPALPSAYVQRAVSSLPAFGLDADQSQMPDVSVRGRMGEMLVAWEIFLDHPFMGVGLRNYESHFQHYSLALDQMPRGGARPAHSLYLEILAERGLVGLASFFGLLAGLAAFAARGWQELLRLGYTREASMISGLAIGFCGYLVAAIFLHDAFPRYFWLVAGLLMAVPGMVRGLCDGAQVRSDRR